MRRRTVPALSLTAFLGACAQQPSPVMTWVHPGGVLAPGAFAQTKATCKYQAEAATPSSTNYQSSVADQVLTAQDQRNRFATLFKDCMEAQGYQYMARDQADAAGLSQAQQRAKAGLAP